MARSPPLWYSRCLWSPIFMDHVRPTIMTIGFQPQVGANNSPADSCDRWPRPRARMPSTARVLVSLGSRAGFPLSSNLYVTGLETRFRPSPVVGRRDRRSSSVVRRRCPSWCVLCRPSSDICRRASRSYVSSRRQSWSSSVVTTDMIESSNYNVGLRWPRLKKTYSKLTTLTDMYKHVNFGRWGAASGYSCKCVSLFDHKNIATRSVPLSHPSPWTPCNALWNIVATLSRASRPPYPGHCGHTQVYCSVHHAQTTVPKAIPTRSGSGSCER